MSRNIIIEALSAIQDVTDKLKIFMENIYKQIIASLSIQPKLILPNITEQELLRRTFKSLKEMKVDIHNEIKIRNYIMQHNINLYALYNQVENILKYFDNKNVKYKAILSLFEDTENSQWKKYLLIS